MPRAISALERLHCSRTFLWDQWSFYITHHTGNRSVVAFSHSQTLSCTYSLIAYSLRLLQMTHWDGIIRCSFSLPYSVSVFTLLDGGLLREHFVVDVSSQQQLCNIQALVITCWIIFVFPWWLRRNTFDGYYAIWIVNPSRWHLRRSVEEICGSNFPVCGPVCVCVLISCVIYQQEVTRDCLKPCWWVGGPLTSIAITSKMWRAPVCTSDLVNAYSYLLRCQYAFLYTFLSTTAHRSIIQ